MAQPRKPYRSCGCGRSGHRVGVDDDGNTWTWCEQCGATWDEDGRVYDGCSVGPVLIRR